MMMIVMSMCVFMSLCVRVCEQERVCVGLRTRVIESVCAVMCVREKDSKCVGQSRKKI